MFCGMCAVMCETEHILHRVNAQSYSYGGIATGRTLMLRLGCTGNAAGVGWAAVAEWGDPPWSCPGLAQAVSHGVALRKAFATAIRRANSRCAFIPMLVESFPV